MMRSSFSRLEQMQHLRIYKGDLLNYTTIRLFLIIFEELRWSSNTEARALNRMLLDASHEEF